jgi:hypothetical protein
MTVVAVAAGKGAPGATTGVLALALTWPGLVLAADCDAAGGDIAPGWLAGRVGSDRGVVTAVTSMRHSQPPLPAEVFGHCVAIPEAASLLVLPGLASAGQAGALGANGWARLAAGLAVAQWPGRGRLDVVADCGRLVEPVPWPVLTTADVVLLVVRPTVRGVWHARHAVQRVSAKLAEPGRLRLLVTGPGPYPPADVGRALGRPVLAVLPDDPAAAAVLADGPSAGGTLARFPLLRAAGVAARRLRAMDNAGGPPHAQAGLVEATR